MTGRCPAAPVPIDPVPIAPTLAVTRPAPDRRALCSWPAIRRWQVGRLSAGLCSWPAIRRAVQLAGYPPGCAVGRLSAGGISASARPGPHPRDARAARKSPGTGEVMPADVITQARVETSPSTAGRLRRPLLTELRAAPPQMPPRTRPPVAPGRTPKIGRAHV